MLARTTTIQHEELWVQHASRRKCAAVLGAAAPAKAGAARQEFIISQRRRAGAHHSHCDMALLCRDISAVILLADGSLVGPIDWGALAQLSAVTDINMELNQLTGTLGTALPPALKTLYLGANNITGTLPQAWDLTPTLRVSGGGVFMQGWLGHPILTVPMHCAQLSC